MKIRIQNLLLLGVALVLVACSVLVIPKAHAGIITNTYLRETNMNAAGTAALRLVYKATQTSGTITIAMNGADTTTWTTTGTGAVTNGAGTFSTATCPSETGTTALAGVSAVSAVAATGIITITGATGLSVGTKYCIDITGTPVTNPTAGEYHPLITQGADSVTVAVRTVTNDVVAVNATVPPNFNFVLSANTDNFSTNLAVGSVVDTTGITATVNTNATTGWIAWAKDANTGLLSATQSKTIASVSPGNASVQTLSAGTEGYLLGITAITPGTGAGTTTATAGYDGSGGAGKGDGLDTTFRQIASSTGTAGNAILTIKQRAAISGTTPASSDYTDNITFLAAGNF